MSAEGAPPSAGRPSDAPAIARASSDPDDRHVEQPGPAEMRDPFIREELKRASVWFGLALAIAALIFAGIVLASMLDGGTRLLGRVLPIGRGWRLAIVTLAAVGFIVWVFYFAGTELIGQAERLRQVITAQGNRVLAWGNSLGIVIASEIGFHVLSFLEMWLTLWLITGESHIAAAFILDTVGRATNVIFKVVPLQLGVLQIGSEIVANALGMPPGTGVAVSLIRTIRVLFWAVVGLGLALGAGPRN